MNHAEQATVMVLGRPTGLAPVDYGIERDRLAASGVALVIPVNDDEVARSAPNVDGVLTGEPIDRARIDQLRRCVGIVAYSIGLDHIDVRAAHRAGIEVRNVPDYCVDEVSDHALMLLLAAARRLHDWAALAAGRPGIPASDRPAPWRLKNRTVGIVGAGRIGSLVARKARVFGCRTVAYDPYLESASEGELPLIPYQDLLQQSDAIILCASMTPGAAPIFGSVEIKQLGRPSPIVVNVARGGLVDEAALAAALRSGRVGMAALDVRTHEPPIADHDPLAGLPNVILTPHVAWWSAEALDDLRRGAAGAMLEILESAGRIEGQPQRGPRS